MIPINEYLINNHLKTPSVKLIDKKQFFTNGTDWEDEQFCAIRQYDTDYYVWIAKVQNLQSVTPSNDYFKYKIYYGIKYIGKGEDNEIWFNPLGTISINTNSGTFEEPDEDMLKVVSAVEEYVAEYPDMLKTKAVIHADAYKKYYDAL